MAYVIPAPKMGTNFEQFAHVGQHWTVPSDWVREEQLKCNPRAPTRDRESAKAYTERHARSAVQAQPKPEFVEQSRVLPAQNPLRAVQLQNLKLLLDMDVDRGPKRLDEPRPVVHPYVVQQIRVPVTEASEDAERRAKMVKRAKVHFLALGRMLTPFIPTEAQSDEIIALFGSITNWVRACDDDNTKI